MCKFCEGIGCKTLIEDCRKVNPSFDYDDNIKFSEAIDEDSSVTFEIINDDGYIRLVNRDDCNCLESGKYFKIKYCLECGRKLGNDNE